MTNNTNAEKMKSKELRKIIREAITDVLSEVTKVTPGTQSDEISQIAKSEKTTPQIVTQAINQARY